ncbi:MULTISPECIES: hypothetical protein [Paenibacillus]|uniref:Uncharacterized protein n=1 Tax=Paenibacillus albilobatus TaxID=2716884 RepID=A0A919XH92_9BACL|nr:MULTISPECIES: hypothetical protein [Paenibacillus]GIO32176.1 hypothetical protein J2TS6_33170 [Paenibacillus albilobatus]
MLIYRCNEDVARITETVNGEDVEFRIRLLQEEPYLNRLREIRKHFEDNDVYTDALFYVYKNHEYGAIVRKDYYVDFVLALMKHGLLRSVEWKADVT